MAELVAMTVGGVDVLVEAVRLPGSEPTSIGDHASDKVLDAFEMANRVVAGAAESTWQMLQGLAAKAGHPDRLEVEFGMKYSVKGTVVIAGAAAEGSLKIKLVYDNKTAPKRND
jgi:hypothetical protein